MGLNERDTFQISVGSFKQFLKDAFLPVGYPNSVSGDYLQYQIYDSLQAFCSTISSLLASRAILKGLGVGDATTSANWAIFLTIVQDMVARNTTILFAWRLGLNIEPEAKFYRFIADAFNDAAFLLDLTVPVLTTYPKVSALIVAQALRALCGVAAGASKAALSSHFARANNIAELNTKEASQETAVGLVGLMVGSLMLYYVEDFNTVFVVMICLVFAHLYFNYCGVRCVELNVLNRQRATLVVQHYARTGEVLTPAEVASKESILLWTPYITRPAGEDHATTHLAMARSYADMTSDYEDHGDYLISWKTVGKVRYGRIFVVKQDIDAQENLCIIKAWARAVLIASSSDHCCEEKNMDEGLWHKIERAGWSTETQGIETGAAMRLWYSAVIDPRKKDQ